jgi:hypothetical protein
MDKSLVSKMDEVLNIFSDIQSNLIASTNYAKVEQTKIRLLQLRSFLEELEKINTEVEE